MFVFPEDKPVICGIRSIYVHTATLIKYYQEQIDAGCIHFYNEKAECVIFFDNRVLINGFFRGPNQNLTGNAAIAFISQPSSLYDFAIDVFEIASEQIVLWSGMQAAKAIHANLSTEFTDLKKLILKMTGQKLTGYIEISISSNNEGGRIFLANGKLLGGTYSWMSDRLSRDKDHIEELIAKTKAFEGVFNVYSVLKPEKGEMQIDTVAEKSTGTALSPEGLKALEAFLNISESIIATEKKIKNDFHILLNKKFVQQVDKYPFLDPFAGEFEYRQGKITFTGEAEEKLLATGLISSIISLMEEFQLADTLTGRLVGWRNKYGSFLERWAISLSM
jgi:hypothetical protein